MILRFSIRNWMSFQSEATLNMVATREKQHSNHLLVAPAYDLKVLPIAAIYGGNASGKSNLTKSILFAKKFITDPPKAGANIPVNPFLLGLDSDPAGTDFRFELLVKEKAYRYEFSITSSRVVREELFEIHPRSEEMLFKRNARSGTEQFELSRNLAKSNPGLQFAFQGTQENLLFLTNSVSQKHEEFKPVYDWFDHDLVVISPDFHYGRLPDLAKKDAYATNITRWLHDLDSGIHCISESEQSEDLLPRSLIETLGSRLEEGSHFWLSNLGLPEGDFLILENGRVAYRRITPIHRSQAGKDVAFPFASESDGTRRLMDLLPAFFFLHHSFLTTTYVIDELDRSLHSNLTKSLITNFLDHRERASRAQLIFTTHDTELMSQRILRRDEIWITERDKGGASTLTAFSEFKDVRKDRDIRKSYLQGRMGGIPRLRQTTELCDDEVEAG